MIDLGPAILRNWGFSDSMKILFIGDIVGRPGRKAVSRLLPHLRENCGPFSFVVVNGENAAGGKGLTKPIVDELLERGVDAITTGNHVWGQREVLTFIDEMPNIVRPANYPKGTPGKGCTIVSNASGERLGVINVAGQVYMEGFNNPFHTLDEVLHEMREGADCMLLDFHAEATAEKVAMGWYADGKVGAVVGTHTHVQTADERLLPNGTAYITDVGMTGPYDSVIGVCKERVLHRFLTMLPTRHEVAKEDVILCAVVLHLDNRTGKALSIRRLRFPLTEEEDNSQS